MRKAIVFAVLVLFSLLLTGQEEPQEIPTQPDEQAQVQAAEPAQAEEQPAPPPAPVQGRDLNKVRIPQPFIHAGSEYPAGVYWLVLAERDGQSYFAVHNDRKEPLFEELAIAKTRSGSGLRVAGRGMTADREFFRLKVAAPGAWLYGFFLVKK